MLVGLIIGFLGVSQLERFGSVVYVPELVVVAQFRELGPLVTAIVVAGRSGAGLASELATMKVSEEIDALQSMGFDPMRWLVVPRCLALVAVLPLLTWIGDVLALVGGFIATAVSTDMPARAYFRATADAITASHLLAGLVKTPVSGAGDRTDRMRPGAGNERWRRRSRRSHDDGGSVGNSGCDCYRRRVYALLRGHGDLTCLQRAAHYRRRSANRLGVADANGARQLSGCAGIDLRDTRRLRERQEYVASISDRP